MWCSSTSNVKLHAVEYVALQEHQDGVGLVMESLIVVTLKSHVWDSWTPDKRQNVCSIKRFALLAKIRNFRSIIGISTDRVCSDTDSILIPSLG